MKSKSPFYPETLMPQIEPSAKPINSTLHTPFFVLGIFPSSSEATGVLTITCGVSFWPDRGVWGASGTLGMVRV